MFKPYQKLVFFDFETTGLDVSSDPDVGCLPIELSLLVTDNELNIIGRSLTMLIAWDALNSYGQEKWDKLEATKVHNIKLDEVISHGVYHHTEAKHDMTETLAPHIIDIYLKELKIKNSDQLILISDNPYFDFTLLKKLYNVKTDNPIMFPFHYNCYSPLMLFKAIEMEKSSKYIKVHRSLDDVYDLYKSCVIAFDRLGIFEEKEVGEEEK